MPERTSSNALSPDIGKILARIYLRILEHAQEVESTEKAYAAPSDLAGPGAAHGSDLNDHST